MRHLLLKGGNTMAGTGDCRDFYHMIKGHDLGGFLSGL